MPESQWDRFGVLIKPGYPTIKNEKKILLEFKNSKPLEKVEFITDKSKIINLIYMLILLKYATKFYNILLKLAI